MKTKNLLIVLSYGVAFLVGSDLYAQDTKHKFLNGEYYLMSEDLEGPDSGEQYFLMEEVSNAVLDGSSYYYMVSMEQPHEEDADCMGIKITCVSAGKDTVRRVRFDNCETGLYIAPLTGGGLVDSCRFFENDYWGFRMGRGVSRDIEITGCYFRGNRNGAAIKSCENVWFHHNNMPFDTLTAILLRGHSAHGPAMHNIIEHNTIANHGRYGLEISHNADSNIVRFNEFVNDGLILTDNSDYNFISDNHISDCDTAIIVELCKGNIFESNTIENSIIHLYLDQNSDVIFVGTIFDSSKVLLKDATSELTVQWFLGVNVVDVNEDPLEDVVVSVFDNQNQLVAMSTTNAEGAIDTQKLTSYIMKRNLLDINTPFKIKTDIASYDSALIDLNQNLQITFSPSGVSNIIENKNSPKTYSLGQNFPNPFNPETKIRYQLSENADVSLKIFDINGRLVRVLVNDFQDTGEKEVTWDGKDTIGRSMSSGIYFYRLETGQYSFTKRMVLLK
jgi:parallel beta-helix repeat protein